MNKSHLATISEISCPEKNFKALNKKNSITNFACLCQLFCDWKTISTHKNVAVLEKYKVMLNFNAEVRI